MRPKKAGRQGAHIDISAKKNDIPESDGLKGSSSGSTSLCQNLDVFGLLLSRLLQVARSRITLPCIPTFVPILNLFVRSATSFEYGCVISFTCAGVSNSYLLSSGCVNALC